MNAIPKWTMALALLSAAAAYGQVPASNDVSDDNANTGMGTDALGGPTAFNLGFDNTAAGDAALRFNKTGNFNTAIGAAALANNTTNNNTATGYSALIFNQLGADNTAVGFEALYTNDKPATGTANQNTAMGSQALFNNTTGNTNTATGYKALFSNTTGSNNIAIGHQAGSNAVSGSNNIEIGHLGGTGDNNLIRIGTEKIQKKAFIAGVFNNTAVSGLSVVVDSNGQLGALSSSKRFKTDIAPMGSNTAKLDQLRPVTFRYKADPQSTRRYGLIAEEVAKIYPELVVRDDTGRIAGVRYDELAPMLLNEMQKEHATVSALAAQHEADAAKITALAQKVADVDELRQQLSAVIQELKRDKFVAQR